MAIRTEYLNNYEQVVSADDVVQFNMLWEGTDGGIPNANDDTHERTMTYDVGMKFTSDQFTFGSPTSLASSSGVSNAVTEYTTQMDISGTQEFSIASTVYYGDYDLGTPTFLTLENDSGEYIGFSYDSVTKLWHVIVVDQSGLVADFSPPVPSNPPLNQWFQLQLVRDAGSDTLTIYSNGNSIIHFPFPNNLVFSSNAFRLRMESEFINFPSPLATIYYGSTRVTIGPNVVIYPGPFVPVSPLRNFDVIIPYLATDETGTKNLVRQGNSVLAQNSIFGTYSLAYNPAGPGSQNIRSSIYTQYTVAFNFGPYDMTAEGYIDMYLWQSPPFFNSKVFSIINALGTGYISIVPSTTTSGALRVDVVSNEGSFSSSGVTVLNNLDRYHWALMKLGNKVFLMLNGNQEIEITLPSSILTFGNTEFRAQFFTGGGISDNFPFPFASTVTRDSDRIVMEAAIYSPTGFTPPNTALGIYDPSPPTIIPDCGILPVNHEIRALSRLTTEYTASTNLQNYILAVMNEANPLEIVFQEIVCLRTLDFAVGTQLDILGELIGQPREFVDASIISYFGFQGQPQSQAFGDLNNPAVGGRFRSLSESTGGFRQLSDIEYRVFIRARIFSNTTEATIENTINQLQNIFSASFIQLTEDAPNSHYDILIGRVLSLNQKLIITGTNILPKTAGVSVQYSDLNGPIN